MFQEDLGQFFEEFAVEAIFTRGGEPVTTTNVIFNDPSQSLQLYDASVVEEAAPFLLAPASELAAVRRRDEVAVNGADYTVERLRPDGTGLLRLDLRKA